LSAFVQGLAETGAPRARAVILKLLDPSYRNRFPAQALPSVLRAAAKLKVENLSRILREQLSHPDMIVRSNAASLLADLSDDENLAASIDALALAKNDPANDAKLAILTAVSKHKKPEAVEAVKSALADRDHLVRRHAVDLLGQMGAGDGADRIGVVQTGHGKAFYQRVVARLDKKVTATIHTTKGRTRIELFPRDAPITVDSFITLARKGYFNGLTFHRVVPNFVIQGGDPRGDGEGGPGYQIRCEVNTRPYTRGAVGMALSGKDTGGSQFFITHSPQPHLDGGYTVFGQVISGMEVVDRISRGDVIRRVEIFESRRLH
jgi:cyclophilin family peptidyl-prolyl cis-trans isomerase